MECDNYECQDHILYKIGNQSLLYFKHMCFMSMVWLTTISI